MADNKSAAKPGKSLTKSAVYQELATHTGLTRKQIGEVFDALFGLVKRELGKKGPGQLSIPGLVKVLRHKKPARKARPGRNPATGEAIMIPAKPASTVIKARVLKDLKALA